MIVLSTKSTAAKRLQFPSVGSGGDRSDWLWIDILYWVEPCIILGAID